MDEQERIKKQREIDESATFIADHFPSLWWNMFTNMKKEGFTDEQALRLLIAHITQRVN